MTVTNKGLSKKELAKIIGFDEQQWLLFFAVYQSMISSYNGFFQIMSKDFKAKIFDMFVQKGESSKISQLHLEIADVVEKSPNSIRRLEELQFHLSMGKSYFRLKETLADIENFLLMFNPQNKYDLCRYW